MRIVSMTGVALLLIAPALAEGIDLQSAGVSAGGSWMTQDWDYDAGLELDVVDGGLFAPSIGFFANVRITESFSLGLEGIYVERGFKTELMRTNAGSPEELGTFTESYGLHTLSLPLTARYRVAAGSMIVYPMAGIGLNVILDKGDDYPLRDDLRSTALALHVGAGCETGRFGFNLRYIADLTNSYDRPSPEDGGATLDSIKNHGVLAMVSYAVWP